MKPSPMTIAGSGRCMSLPPAGHLDAENRPAGNGDPPAASCFLKPALSARSSGFAAAGSGHFEAIPTAAWLAEIGFFPALSANGRSRWLAHFQAGAVP
jgi:hypothetical protein